MHSQSKKLENKINSLRSQLNEYPDGKLICTKNGTYSKWYVSDGKTCTYLPKKERTLAEKLAAKKYLSLELQELEQEKNAIDSYLKLHSKSPSKSQQLLTEHSAFHELLVPYFQTDKEDLLQWSTAPYKHNPAHPEQCIINTASGHMVRSKSEALIDTMLYMKKIPFRYECALPLGNLIFYPDFTVRNPFTKKTY